MHLTRESEYALLALTFLVKAGPGATVSTKEMAEAQNLPPQFIAKILQKLGRAGIVNGGRGRGHGYSLARIATSITLHDVLTAVEPPANMDSCLLWQGYCGDRNPCPLHHRLKPMHGAITGMLADVTLVEYVHHARHRAIRGAELPLECDIRHSRG